MAENSKIEWTHHTANLWWGCTEVHSGCDNCYARVFSHRYDGGKSLWGNDVPRRRIKSVWGDLERYQRMAAKAGEMHRVFVGSMMDIFEKSMPLANPEEEHFEFTDDMRQELFTEITWGDRGLYPNLMFLFLTKRPSNIAKMVPAGWLETPPPNVMYGTSVVDQKTADTLIPQLMRVPGKKFLSIEPQLDVVDLRNVFGLYEYDDGKYSLKVSSRFDSPDWIICGGESGQNKRPFNPDWARLLRDQCNTAGVPFFMKQIDKVQPIPEDLMIRQFQNYEKLKALI